MKKGNQFQISDIKSEKTFPKFDKIKEIHSRVLPTILTTTTNATTQQFFRPTSTSNAVFDFVTYDAVNGLSFFQTTLAKKHNIVLSGLQKIQKILNCPIKLYQVIHAFDPQFTVYFSKNKKKKIPLESAKEECKHLELYVLVIPAGLGFPS